jgi:hypothetical protein
MTNLGADFQGYSYRTSSRFGSRVNISIDDKNVTITGPRTSVFFYRLWIAAQVVLFWLIGPTVVTAVILRNWWYVVLVPALLIVHWVVSSFGAGCLWELANLTAFAERKMGETHSFPLNAIKRVKVGRGWARNGLWLVILPYIPGINQMAGEYVVSFEAPDGETGKDAVYAFHMQTTEEAQALARRVEGT